MCRYKPNSQKALSAAGFGAIEATDEICEDVVQNYVAKLQEQNPNAPICGYNLTAFDVIEYDVKSDILEVSGGAAGDFELFTQLYPGAKGSGIVQFYNFVGGTATQAAKDLLLCVASHDEDCETYKDRDTVCNRTVDFFPFAKSPAISKSSILYMLTFDSVSLFLKTMLLVHACICSQLAHFDHSTLFTLFIVFQHGIL